MMSAQTTSVSAERRRAMLRTAMGPAIAAALADPRVIEIMVNPDGALRVDILGEGRVDTDVKLDAPQIERIILALEATMPWRLMTALGSPVDPDVIMYFATVSGVRRA